ncbi:MAG: FG-GAP repeat protein, partial [Burkholderiales bacterium]|nr:FG-GAP repeat protein [Burkholderiales bacterium]
DAFALAGAEEGEALSGAVRLTDFNGDREADLLVTGDEGSYLLFGPVQLDAVADVAGEADVLIDADVGRAADRMGDINGDGYTDLLFIRRADNGASSVITAVLGGPREMSPIDLPRRIDRAWIDQVLAVTDQNRVRQIEVGVSAGTTSLLATALSNEGSTLSVLNWNDDGFADILVTAETPFTGASQTLAGFVLSGQSMWSAEDAARTAWGVSSLARFVYAAPSATQIRTEAQALLLDGGGTGSASSRAVNNSRFVTTVAGDINGDGLDDVLIADAGAIVFPGAGEGGGEGALADRIPNYGKTYLVTGRTAVNNALSITTASSAVVAGFGIGGGVSALGDLDGDGYDEFAVSRTVEGRKSGPSDRNEEGGALVFRGSAAMPGTANPLQAEDAFITIRRDAAADIPAGVTYGGVLQVSAGDFNADGKADLLIGEPTRVTTATGSGNVLDTDQRGTAYVVFSAIEQDGDVVLTQADSIIRGQFEFDRFGRLATTPAMDIDSDGNDDLLIGARGADFITESVVPGAGKLFVGYGSSTPPSLPAQDQIIDLLNLTVAGSGDYLVDTNTGRPEVFESLDINGDGIDDFVLQSGESQKWYRFTTLGDGENGNVIRVGAGVVDTFVEAVRVGGSDTVTVNPSGAVGGRIVQRSTVDGAIGSLFVADPFFDVGRVTEWSIQAGTFSGARTVTPVIYRVLSDGSYQISGVGTTRTVDGGTQRTFDFGLVSGSDAVGADYRFGWKDGSTTADNAGVIAYDNGYDFSAGNPSYYRTVQWLGQVHGEAGNVAVGNSFASAGSFVRAYSVQAQVSKGAILEFDLGAFLEYAGNPELLEGAQLILDAPGAVAPVAAPTNVGNVTPSGGLLYFTAQDTGSGNELWVTDGTAAGTRRVADLNPGQAGSAPANLP